MQLWDRWIDRYLARVRWGEYLQRAAEWFAAFLFCFGGAVLIVRLWIPAWWPHVLWLGLGAIPAGIGAWYMARRNQLSRTESIAQLDRSLQTGGLLMTLTERPDPQWAAQLPQLELIWREALPKLRPRRFASYLMLPLLFALGTFFVPLREANTAPVLRNTVGREATQQLEELLESLDEAKILEEEEQKQLQEEIARLVEETEQSPLTHEKWEAIDALRERMRIRVDEAAATAAKFAESAAMLAKAASLDASELTSEQMLLLEKDVAEALSKLMDKGAFSGASQELQDQLQRLTKNGKLQLPGDAAAREQLLNELREHLEREQRELAELRSKCKACEGGECAGGECEGGFCKGTGPARDGNGPGRGGVNRGRGDAPLTWGEESDKEGTKFKEVILPPGFLDQPKDEIVGIQRTAPTDEPAAAAPRSASRQIDPSTGRETWDRRVSPRHRNVVRKFFSE